MPVPRLATLVGAGVLSVALLATSAPVATAASSAAPATSASTLGALTQSTAGYPRQEPLAVLPEDPDDASRARGALAYDQIAPILNGVMQRSDRVSTEVVGQSTLGKDIYLVTVTAPETPAETAEQTLLRQRVRDDAAAAASDEDLQARYKTPIWFNANIHGNEWEGTDGSMNRIVALADATDPEVEDLLSKHRLYFTVSINPDGRVAGTRQNGQGLDLNRDFITNESPETRVLRDLTAQLQPLYFTDLHGYTGVLQVEPCGPPHGENYDYDLFIPHAYASALRIEQDVLAAEIPGNPDSVRIPYRDIPSGWDDWPPIFTAQYLAFHGALASTAELPLGRTDDPATNVANSRVDTEVAEQVIDSTIAYVTENNSELLDNQIEIFRRGAAGEPLRAIPVPADGDAVPGPDQWVAEWGTEDQYTTTFPRAYVLPAGEQQDSATDTARLVDQLVRHNIEVEQASTAFTLGGASHPAGSYVVDMRQPLRGLVNALLADGSDISDRVPTMYDISAWSLGRLWGSTVLDVPDADTVPDDLTQVVMASPTGSFPSARGHLKLQLAGVAELQAVNALLDGGFPVVRFPDGSVVVPPAGFDAARVASSTYGVSFTPTSGAELSDPEARPLTALTVGYTVGNTYRGGGEDLLALTEMGFTDLVPVSAARLEDGRADLTGVDVLWVAASLTPTEEQPAATVALADYVARGGGIVGRGAGAAELTDRLGVLTAPVSSARRDANGIVRLQTAPDGVLAAAAEDADGEFGFAYPPQWFAAGDGVTVEQTYVSDPLLAGHWLPTQPSEEVPFPTGNGPAVAAGKPSVVSGTGPTGSKALLFGTAPLFRGHPKGMFDDVALSLMWAGPDGDAVAAPAPSGTFSDVAAGDAFAEEIGRLAGLGVAQGFGDGTFGPALEVRRSQMAAFLYRLAGTPTFTPPATPTFLDVPAADPSSDAVEWLADQGITLGRSTPSGLVFEPGNGTSRLQMAAFLYRYSGQPAFDPPVEPTFADVTGAPATRLAVEWLASVGITQGETVDGELRFRPEDGVSRGQMAAFLVRTAELASPASTG